MQHGGPPDWLVESYPGACDFVRDGQSMLPALTDHTTEYILWTTPLDPVWGLSITKCTQNTVISYVTQGRHRLYSS
jgi:hypothetical protein